jgi:hypothetical protein
MRRAYGLCLAFALCGCVLPEYKVFDDSAKQPISPGKIEEGAISFGDAACSSCVSDSCLSEHASCGADCQDLKYPMSPAWNVTDAAEPFVRCVATQCEAACNVLWGCVKNYRWPEKDAAYSVTLRVNDALQEDRNIAGATVTACQGRDPACSVGMGQESSGTTDANGHVTLALSRGFVGYFLVEKKEDGYVPMIASWSQPSYVVDNTFTVSMFKPAWIQAMASQVNVMLEKDVGHVIFKALNCLPLRYIGDAELNADAEGVSVSYTPRSSGSSDVVYVSTGLAIDRAANATSTAGLGYGGIFNLPAGAVTLSGSHEGLDVGSAQLPMRANNLGVVFMVPRAK